MRDSNEPNIGGRTIAQSLDRDVLERDANGKPVPTFPHPALIRVFVLASMALLAACRGNIASTEMAGRNSAFCLSPQITDEAGFGCATQHNIAAQAENAEDLYKPRRERPRDAMRRDAVLTGYARSQAAERGAVQTDRNTNQSAETQK